MKPKKSTTKKYFWIYFFFLYAGELSVIFILFKKIRGLFLGPQIGENKIVSYSQYFGYPYYFDTILFFVIIFSPSIIMFILKFAMKKKNFSHE